MERNRNYRREVEKSHLRKRKVITNKVKDWKLSDEEVKIKQDYKVNWANNEFSYLDCNKKGRINRQKNKIKLKKEIIEEI